MNTGNEKPSLHQPPDDLSKNSALKCMVEIGEYKVSAEYEMEEAFRQLLADVLICERDIPSESLQDRIGIR